MLEMAPTGNLPKCLPKVERTNCDIVTQRNSAPMRMTYNYTQQYGKKALANTILNKKARNKIQYRQAKLIYVARSQTGRVA